ncbi:MAG: hypothetical protein V4724_38230 [Pseudomonadota bacterium]
MFAVSGTIQRLDCTTGASPSHGVQVNDRIPEAYELPHDFSGLINVTGFLAAFVLAHMAA